MKDAWAEGRSIETQVLARYMMSAIRYDNQDEPRYQCEMRRLCALIDVAEQQRKEEDACGIANLDVATQSRTETDSARRSAAKTSPKPSKQPTEQRSTTARSAAVTAASDSRKQR